MTTHASLRAQWPQAESVYHVQGLGDGNVPTSPIKIQGCWASAPVRGWAARSLMTRVYGLGTRSESLVIRSRASRNSDIGNKQTCMSMESVNFSAAVINAGYTSMRSVTISTFHRI